MITYINKETRGKTQLGWLNSHHSFSFGDYHDPKRMGFGPLRVINDDVVAGGGGFPAHGHANMEIITIPLSGALAHKDSLGNGSTIQAGDVQMMRAGTGIRHSEFNASLTDAAHFLQIWIMPDEANAQPAYQQARFDVLDPSGVATGAWQALVVPADQADEQSALRILQDTVLSAARLAAGQKLSLPPTTRQRRWLHIATGSVRITTDSGQSWELSGGDALALEKETAKVDIEAVSSPDKAEGGALALLFDLGR